MHCIISTVVVAFEINYLILSYLISFRDKEGVLKFNVGATNPLPYPVR